MPGFSKAAEDDGVLVFTVLNGENRTSSFVAVDAASMQTLQEATLPGDPIGFTTHGQYYSGLLV